MNNWWDLLPMPTRTLTLARTIVRAAYHPKNILVHSRGADVAADFYPDPFEHWSHSTRGITLHHKANRLRAVILGDLLELLFEPPSTSKQMFATMVAMAERYERTVSKRNAPRDLSLFQIYLSEHSSFEELFPIFKENVTRDDGFWPALGGHEVRDVGLTNLHYGKAEDGLDLSIGVYSAAQAQTFVNEVPDFPDDESRLQINEGALMIMLRRYSQKAAAPVARYGKALTRWSGELDRVARQLFDSTLKEKDVPGQ